MSPRRTISSLIVSCAAAAALFYVAPGALQVSRAEVAAPHLDHIDRAGQRQQMFHVYSAAMQRVIPLQVIAAAQPNSPTLYLLNGASGGTDITNWYSRTDVVSFFWSKNVNVVTPVGGEFSYYTDWQRDDPNLGRNRWETFLTRELPPIIDATLHTSGVNAIAGVSMSATSALDLMSAAPDVYSGVAAYSGCASTSDPAGRAYIRLVLGRGDADPTNMWGPDDDPAWRAHDAILNADSLRGKAIYLASGTGLPGPAEAVSGQPTADQLITKANQMVLGGLIEAATNSCTHQLADRLTVLGIPAQVDFRPAGTHTWAYWQNDLHNSWPLLAAALGTE
ncbi:alpha/beta hydrolase [Nocardia concava]|uniref:alpha/beta hydrolase n=1 Tax=Nocardia concava TaxID=257281 RepID=UPI0002DAA9BB|nr:alpha/beta hydrolase family protein [Nocardia concava]